jgi:hypothetical protein
MPLNLPEVGVGFQSGAAISMREVEEIRRVYEEKISPMLRAVHSATSSIDGNLDSRERSFGLRGMPAGFVEITSQALYENIVLRLECLQQSFAFDKRISDLEADKQRSAWP